MRDVALYYTYTSSLLVPEIVLDDGLPFYNLQNLPGLQELPRTQDSHSPPIFIPHGGSLVFGDAIIRKLYVSAELVTSCKLCCIVQLLP
jgi:hypothetical protein